MLPLWYLFGSLITYEERLHRAIEQRNATAVIEILKRKPLLNTPECEIDLKLVSEDDDPEIAIELVKSGASLKSLPQDILHRLISSGNSNKHELAYCLLDRNENVNNLDDQNRRPIFYAIQCESQVMINELMEHNAIIDTKCIELAVRKDSLQELLPLLILHKVDSVETKNRRALMALSTIVKLNKMEEEILNVVNNILVLNLNLNQFDVNCRWGSILLHAITWGRSQIAELLIEHGAEVDGETLVGVPPLFAAVMFRQHSIVQLLLRKGARIERRHGMETFMNPRSIQGFYPIHVACRNFYVTSLKLLLSYGADINILDNDNMTPFALLKRRMTSAHKVMIRHIAILDVTNVNVLETDRNIIDYDLILLRYYQKCRRELNTTKGIKVTPNTYLYDVITKNVKELSFLTRNEYFVERYREHLKKNLYPVYFPMMKFIFQEATFRRNVLWPKEKAILALFRRYLPGEIIERILFYYYL